jgi:hypothetical protein
MGAHEKRFVIFHPREIDLGFVISSAPDGLCSNDAIRKKY